MFNSEATRDLLVEWLAENVKSAGAKGLVFGLSGGIDSAVVAGLSKLAFPDTSLGAIMPCHSNPTDKEDALLVANAIGLQTQEVDLTEPFDYLVAKTGVNADTMAAHNLKPRLRSSTLGLIGQSLGYLVAGGSNLAEWYTGYFTKYGDSAVDLLPLARLTKSEVYQLAKVLKIPEKIITKAPSAGLWQGQTDEEEMGIKYADLDKYLTDGTGEEEIIARIEALHKRSAHKRQMPPMGPVVRG